MILDRVTITGADDSVTVEQLAELSDQFPFVEWGILFSSRQQGTPRFPAEDWLRGLQFNHGVRLQLSAHLCGRWVRDALAGQPTWWAHHEPIASRFQRVQLNFHAEPHSVALAPFLADHRGIGQTFIFQCDGVNDPGVKVLVEQVGGSPLFDTSGGAGVLPDAGWPAAWPGVYCGYAGGLGPRNVVEQLRLIEAAAPGNARLWIDMERRVRSTDDRQLDLVKVKAVLVQVEPFVVSP